jgi:hypothetical protein
MKHETAQLLLELILRHSSEQNAFLSSLAGTEPEDQIKKITAMIGQTMGAIYLKAIRPILAEHPDLTPHELKTPD